MARGQTVLSQDNREIHSVYAEATGRIYLNKDGVTKIEAYDEFGQNSFVPWIAVWRNGDISLRLPANLVIVSYEKF